jgi:DNA-binding GntR family transcriptional regulator
VVLDILQSKLASIANISRSVLHPLLRDLEADGALCRIRRAIRIHSVEALRDICRHR